MNDLSILNLYNTIHSNMPVDKLMQPVFTESDPDTFAKEWITEQVNNEISRLKSLSTSTSPIRPLPLPVSNMSIVVDYTRPKYPKSINRIEVQTAFKFNKVTQIMVSEPIKYPGTPAPNPESNNENMNESENKSKENWEYVNVLLFTTTNVFPIILPYLYNPTYRTSNINGSGSVPVKNNLKDWLFINSKGERWRHRIETFHDL
ncbi:hypothetical protein BKA69DRAFT_1094463 [Paraphysoderma sedebokerense]|nr:hypothetical protein BKA69DRAFT_1094463 [Paraphysoderma sedebokerense]